MKALFVLFAAMLFLGSVVVSVKTSPAFKLADSGAALALGGLQDLPAQESGSAANAVSLNASSNSGAAAVLGASTQPDSFNQPVPKITPSADPIRGVGSSFGRF